MASTFPQLMSLPTELRFHIINLAINNILRSNLSPFSVVSRDWQVEVERRTFRKVKVRSSQIDDDFNKIFSEDWRKQAVRHIWLDIELPSYESRCCSHQVPPPRDNSPIVSEAIWRLFGILDDWKPTENLTLELNVLSPSDSQHWFRGLHFSTGHVEGGRNTPMASARSRRFVHHDPNHGLYNGLRVTQAPVPDVSRLFQPVYLRFQGPLPLVPAVTSLILRRQLRRSISPFTLHFLLRCLNRLEEVIYEPWTSYPDCRIYGLSLPLEYHLPETLNKLVIFEDSHKFYTLFGNPWPLMGHLNSTNNLDDHIGHVLAARSRELQHLAVSFAINAEGFFSPRPTDWTWPKLESLALTSNLLQDDATHLPRMSRLLLVAGSWARQMPKMRSFALWNGGRGHACAFIYSVEGPIASLTWRGTWHFELDENTVQRWQEAASAHNWRLTEIRQEHIGAVIRSHGDAIYHLELPCEVVHPASLWQIRREADPCLI